MEERRRARSEGGTPCAPCQGELRGDLGDGHDLVDLDSEFVVELGDAAVFAAVAAAFARHLRRRGWPRCALDLARGREAVTCDLGPAPPQGAAWVGVWWGALGSAPDRAHIDPG